MLTSHRLTLTAAALLLSITLFAQSRAPQSRTAPREQTREIPREELTIEDLSDSVDLYSPIHSSVYNDSLARILPAYDLYRYSWTPLRLNPYHVALDSMPDSVYIDCRDFVYPIESNRVTSNYGWRRYRYHHGLDIGLNVGDTIRATFAGRVRIVDYERRGYGHYVVIRHDNGLETVMAHMSRVLVHIDQDVVAGQPIGLGGSTGRSTGPHLHYEFRFLGNAFNPLNLVDFENKRCLAAKDGFYLITKKATYAQRKEVATQTGNSAYHRVRSGETLGHIARRYHTTVRRLCQLNHLRETSILQIGQKIRYR